MLALLALLPLDAFALDYDDLPAFCTAVFEDMEAEIADLVASGDMSAVEAEEVRREADEGYSMEQCLCHWRTTRELAGPAYTRRLQAIWLEGATIGELAEVDEQALFDGPAELTEEALAERVEAACDL